MMAGPLRKILDVITGVPSATIVSLKELQTETIARRQESTRQLEDAFKELDVALTRVAKNVRSS